VERSDLRNGKLNTHLEVNQTQFINWSCQSLRENTASCITLVKFVTDDATDYSACLVYFANHPKTSICHLRLRKAYALELRYGNRRQGDTPILRLKNPVVFIRENDKSTRNAPSKLINIVVNTR